MSDIQVNLSGKVAIVTGAGRGIGRATAIRLAKARASVVVTSRTQRDIDETKSQIESFGGKAIAVAADAAVEADVDRLISETLAAFDGVDILINNAGVAPLMTIDEMTPEVFDKNYSANIRSVYLCTRAVWGLLADRGGGVVVNTASVAAYDAFPGFAAYGAAKAFVVAYSKFLAREGADKGIRVFGVAPGAVETDMLREAFPDFPKEQTLDPDDIARMFELLVSDACRYSSGQTITVSKSI